jgi:hypothetical protein
LAVVFLAGLLLGWLVIGWMLWPVQWIDATPATLRLDDQRQFVTLVAGEYAQTGNAALAQERLASWDEESLATLLALMERQAVDEAAQSALAGLRGALLIPQTTLSFWDTILNQKLIVISAVLGGLMLLTAVALTLYPSIHQARVRQARQKQMETEEEVLLMANADTAVSTPPALPQEQTAAETAVPSPAAAQPEPQTPNSQPVQPQPADPPPVAAPADEAQNAANQPQPAPADPAAKTDAAPPNAAPDGTAPPGAQPAAPANPPQPAPPPPVEADEEEEDTDSIQSILMSVFEDDDDSTHYESLLKGLADIDALKLVSLVEQTAKQLRTRRPKGKTAVSPPARTMT